LQPHRVDPESGLNNYLRAANALCRITRQLMQIQKFHDDYNPDFYSSGSDNQPTNEPASAPPVVPPASPSEPQAFPPACGSEALDSSPLATPPFTTSTGIASPPDEARIATPVPKSALDGRTDCGSEVIQPSLGLSSEPRDPSSSDPEAPGHRISTPLPIDDSSNSKLATCRSPRVARL
jgi:hypothetical protein